MNIIIRVTTLLATVFLVTNDFMSAFGIQLKLNLPSEHLPYYFNSFPNLAGECAEDNSCPFKEHLDKNVCWGYENDCGLGKRSYSHPICDGDHRGWVKTKQEQIEAFFKEGDFGYIKEFRNSLRVICKPQYQEDSSLECTENLTFCRARNIMIDFRDLLNRSTPVMYDMDVLKPGQIGGYCDFDEDLLKRELGRMSALQSWSPELQHFVRFSKRPLEKESDLCDHIVKTPTYIMKIDATVNMYHHFCDFFNLYASLHVNSSLNHPEVFSTNVKILIWRTYKYHSNFEAPFKAFSSYPIQDLNDFKGKRVCFKNAMFPLLPRMIFGLYYNTPLVWGCRNSGLFHAFSKFILHRLGIKRRSVIDAKKIRVTVLSRQTKFRKMVNEDILLESIRKIPDVDVKKVVFTWKTDFLEQLSVIQETDVLIGMHGAGLTHLLFLPDWAALFEVYNCEDENCYADLARLRGVKYITWTDKSKLTQVDGEDFDGVDGTHAKHINYVFDPEEFTRLVKIGVEHVNMQASEFSNNHDEL